MFYKRPSLIQLLTSLLATISLALATLLVASLPNTPVQLFGFLWRLKWYSFFARLCPPCPPPKSLFFSPTLNSHFLPYWVEGDNLGNIPFYKVWPVQLCAPLLSPEPIVNQPLLILSPIPFYWPALSHFCKCVVGPTVFSHWECFNSWYFCSRTWSVISLFRGVEDKGRLLSLLLNRSAMTTMWSAGTLPPLTLFSIHLNWGTWEPFFRMGWAGEGRKAEREKK